jgi:hypothetical protein
VPDDVLEHMKVEASLNAGAGPFVRRLLLKRWIGASDARGSSGSSTRRGAEGRGRPAGEVGERRPSRSSLPCTADDAKRAAYLERAYALGRDF